MKLIASLLGTVGAAWSGYAVIALIAVALFGSGYMKGAASERADIDQEKLETALAYAGEILAQQDRANGLAADIEKLRTAQAPKDRFITREITRYVKVTPPADRCTLPGTWRLLHDAAATGTPIAAETGPLAAAAANPVADAAALETIGINYEACRTDQAKLAGWQRRYQTLEVGQ